MFDRAVREIRASGEHRQAAHTFSVAAQASIMAGDAVAALEYAREARRHLAAHPISAFYLSAMLSEARAHQAPGRNDAAEQVWRQVLDLSGGAGMLEVQAAAQDRFGRFLVDADRRLDRRIVNS